jgi:hypothetical protein
MRASLLILVALIQAAIAIANAQEPKDQRRTVTVEGCLEKTWLKTYEGGSVPFSRHVDKYHLHAQKDLMKQLRDINGHHVEVTGALSDPDNTQGTGKSVMIGKKTRIYTNAREVSDVPPIVDPTIEVSSFRDIAKTCR